MVASLRAVKGRKFEAQAMSWVLGVNYIIIFDKEEFNNDRAIKKGYSINENILSMDISR